MNNELIKLNPSPRQTRFVTTTAAPANEEEKEKNEEGRTLAKSKRFQNPMRNKGLGEVLPSVHP